MAIAATLNLRSIPENIIKGRRTAGDGSSSALSQALNKHIINRSGNRTSRLDESGGLEQVPSRRRDADRA